MKRKILSVFLLALTLSAATPLGVVAAAPGDKIVTKKTPDGYTIKISLLNSKFDAVPPLDSSPFTREAFISGDNTVMLEGRAGAKVISSTLETGYQIGYPAKVGTDGGATVTITTPDLSVNGGVNTGVNASVTPSVQGQGNFGSSGGSGSVGGGVSGTVGGNAGANAGAQSKIIPSQTATFKIEHGGITEIPIGKIAMTYEFAYLSMSGVRISASGAAGQMTVRTYTRVLLRTESGITQAAAYGPAIKL